jgi:hypothetical protein
MRPSKALVARRPLIVATSNPGGFGYDPYFWLPDLGVTAAQLDPADKNRQSHRGIAMRALRDQWAARERAAGERAARDRPVRL